MRKESKPQSTSPTSLSVNILKHPSLNITRKLLGVAVEVKVTPIENKFTSPVNLDVNLVPIPAQVLVHITVKHCPHNYSSSYDRTEVLLNNHIILLA